MDITQDTLIQSIATPHPAMPTKHDANGWLPTVVITSVALVLVFFLITYCKRNKAQRRFKRESIRQHIDFDNIINSSFHAGQLYNELKVKCHPDRFPIDTAKNRTADMLFQEISKNRYNIKKLLELKEQAKRELNINF